MEQIEPLHLAGMDRTKLTDTSFQNKGALQEKKDWKMMTHSSHHNNVTTKANMSTNFKKKACPTMCKNSQFYANTLIKS